MSKMVVIGIAGGSGSGKSTFSRRVIEELVDSPDLAVINHDAYYKPLDHLPVEERKEINFDHPDSLDTAMLVRAIRELREGRPVSVPDYDFGLHTRKPTVTVVHPPAVLIVEGILIFADADLRAQLDIRIFIDTDDDDRLLRRIQRDISERGRALEGILDQYQRTVKPMHLEFVEPSKRWADVIIPRGGMNRVGLEMVSRTLHMLLGKEMASK